MSYENLYKPLDVSENGFITLFLKINKLLPEVNYSVGDLKTFYEGNIAKANDLIEQVNIMLLHRDFWGTVWGWIKNTATTIVNTVVDGIKTIGGLIVTAGSAFINAITLNQINSLHDFVESTANWTFNSASDFIKEFTGIDIKDFSKSDFVQFVATIASFGIGKVLAPEISAIADTIIGTTTSKAVSVAATLAVKTIIDIPVKSFIEFAGNKFNETISIDQVKNDPSIPDVVKNNLHTGEYYYSDGANAYHIIVHDENVALPDATWHDLSGSINTHKFTNADIGRHFGCSQDNVYWEDGVIMGVNNGKMWYSLSDSFSFNSVSWDSSQNGYTFSENDIGVRYDADLPHSGVANYFILQDKI